MSEARTPDPSADPDAAEVGAVPNPAPSGSWDSVENQFFAAGGTEALRIASMKDVIAEPYAPPPLAERLRPYLQAGLARAGAAAARLGGLPSRVRWAGIGVALALAAVTVAWAASGPSVPGSPPAALTTTRPAVPAPAAVATPVAPRVSAPPRKKKAIPRAKRTARARPAKAKPRR